MSLLRSTRPGIRLLNRGRALSLAVGILLLTGSAVSSPAQLPLVAPPPKAEPAATADPLGRQTPRSSMINFLKYEASGDSETASRFLQLPPGETMAHLTTEVRTLYPYFQGSINLLSDDPAGTVEAGLPPGQVSAGVVMVDDLTAKVVLVRVDDPVAG